MKTSNETKLNQNECACLFFFSNKFKVIRFFDEVRSTEARQQQVKSVKCNYIVCNYLWLLLLGFRPKQNKVLLQFDSKFSAQGGIFERWVNMKIQWNRNLSEFEISDRKVIFISYSCFLKCQKRVKQVDTQLQRYYSLPYQSNGVSWNTSVKFYVMLRTSKLLS